METSDKIEFTAKVFECNQNLITLADNKATTLLTLQIAIIGFLLGTSIASDIFKKFENTEYQWLANLFYFLFSIFIITSIGGLIFSLKIFKARFPYEGEEKFRRGLLYFNHIKDFQTSTEFINQLDKLNEQRWLEEVGKQVYNISHILSNKMKFVNVTIYLLATNIFLSVIMTLIIIIFSK